MGYPRGIRFGCMGDTQYSETQGGEKQDERPWLPQGTHFVSVAERRCGTRVIHTFDSRDTHRIHTCAGGDPHHRRICQVAANPATVCRFQLEANCTGFIGNCLHGAGSECPVNCDGTNARFANPCWQQLKGQLQAYYGPVSLAFLIVTLVLLLVIALNWAQCCLLRQRSLQIKARLNRRWTWAQSTAEDEQQWAGLRAAVVLQNLNAREREALRGEFKKVDKNGDGKLSAPELKTFYKAVCEIRLHDEDVQRLLDNNDLDRDGRLDFNEFILMHANDEEAEARRQRALGAKEVSERPWGPCAAPPPVAMAVVGLFVLFAFCFGEEQCTGVTETRKCFE